MPNLDDTDKALLNRIQSDFPISREPYHDIARDLNLQVEDVLNRLRRLIQSGIIRRIGGNFSPEKLGFVSTLCAAKVPMEKLDLFASVVNRYPGVTHNYLRDGEYNVWFTFIAPSMEEIQDHLHTISAETGVNHILNLPATKLFKIKAHFNL